MNFDQPPKTEYFTEFGYEEVFPNGDKLRSYINTHSSLKDRKQIIYTFAKDAGIIGYSENAKDSNEWTISADAPGVDSNSIKEAFGKIDKIIPVDAVITENKTISIDGLKTWNNQLKHGYLPIEDQSKIRISSIDKNNLFKELNPGTENKWGAAIFKNQEDVEKAKQIVQKFLDENGLNYPITVNEDNTIEVAIPKFKKTIKKVDEKKQEEQVPVSKHFENEEKETNEQIEVIRKNILEQFKSKKES